MKPFDLGGPIIFPEGWIPIIDSTFGGICPIIEDEHDGTLCVGCFNTRDAWEWSSSDAVRVCDELLDDVRIWVRWSKGEHQFILFNTTGCETLEEVCALARALNRMGV